MKELVRYTHVDGMYAYFRTSERVIVNMKGIEFVTYKDHINAMNNRNKINRECYDCGGKPDPISGDIIHIDGCKG